MKSNNVSTLLAIIALVGVPTAAMPASGGAQLSAWCGSVQHEGPSARRDHRHLMGYVQGATDAMIDHREACPPDDANVGHGVDIVCRYVANNRQRWSSSKYLLARDALAKAFPCPKR
jgi:hypothetical protein